MIDARTIIPDFPLFKEEHKKFVYLDSASTSQTPNSVIKAMDAYYTNARANTARGVYPLGEKATALFEDARITVAKFLGVDSREVIFTGGATEGSNMMIRMLEDNGYLKEGDEIILSSMEHHATLVPLQELARRKKLTIHFIPLLGTELDYEAYEKLISSKTKLVSVVHASNVLGTINDIARIKEGAKKAGALVFVDGAQSIGHMDVDLKILGADIFFFSGHKMLGPTGIGVLWAKKELLSSLTPAFFGGGMVDTVTKEESSYADIPSRFEAGTRPIAEAIGLAEAVLYIETIGTNALREHGKELVEYAEEKLKGISGVTVYGADPEKNIGVISFTIDGVHPHDGASILGTKGVCVRAGAHCAQPLLSSLGVPALLRASVYCYNTEEDIDALVEAIIEAKNTFA